MPRHLTLTFSASDHRQAFVEAMNAIGTDDFRVDAPTEGPVAFVVHQRGAESGAQSASRLLRFVEQVCEQADLPEDSYEIWIGANPESSFQAFPGYTGTPVGSR